MTGWTPKRFWQTVTVQPADGGYIILLDSRPAKTPGKRPLVVPSLAMAKAAAAEWDAQHGPLKPATMPVTRSINSAIDKVAPQFDEVVNILAAYGETDLLCYRATGPVELIERQNAAWDPLLDWSAQGLHAPLRAVAGVMHIAQPPDSLSRLRALVQVMTAFQITGFHDLVQLSGSLILALAVTRQRLSPAEAWRLSRIDESWQIEQWGDDEEAAALAEGKRLAFHHAAGFWAMSAPN